MRAMISIRSTTIFFALAGFALLAWLLARSDAADIRTAFSVAGLNLLWLAVYRAIPIGLDAQGWRRLLAGNRQLRFADFMVLRWIAESVNTLLPAAQVGGHAVRARLLARKEVDGNLAAASVMVDFTVGLTTQIAFVLTGLMLLLHQSGNQELSGIFLGLAIALIAVGGFYFSQRLGLFSLGARSARLLPGGKKFATLVDNARDLDKQISLLYGQRRRLAGCFAWRLTGWFARSGENWLFFYFSGAPIRWQDAIILESLSTGIRSAAFFVPGGLGVQDGGLLFTGLTLGLGAEGLLALALVKRFRELALGVPGLILWSRLAGRSAAKRLNG